MAESASNSVPNPAPDTAYCVKCKDKREMQEAHQITMKNGKPAMQGTCVVCGTKLTRILSSQKA